MICLGDFNIDMLKLNGARTYIVHGLVLAESSLVSFTFVKDKPINVNSHYLLLMLNVFI